MPSRSTAAEALGPGEGSGVSHLLRKTPFGVPIRQVEIRFRLLEESELNNVESVDKRRKTSIVYDAAGNPIDIETTSVDSSPDEIYEALQELGDLRERGILTEEEFQREKAKVLKRSK